MKRINNEFIAYNYESFSFKIFTSDGSNNLMTVRQVILESSYIGLHAHSDLIYYGL